MTFELCSYRFRFSALDPISFPPGKAGNVLRGWFGHTLRKIAPAEYGRIFEPRATESGPSGFADRPRPFVFRASALDGLTIEAGQEFWFGIHVFDLRTSIIDHFEAAFAHLNSEGLGPRRGRAALAGVEQSGTVSVPLEARSERTSRVRVEFRTPTELKGGGNPADFAVLFCRARDRISMLRALYGPGPLEIDFRAMGQRASAVRITRSDLTQTQAYRRSSKTGQVHSIGGFTGVAEYEGELAEFLPYLETAHWTGVGRQCVWGKGEITVSSAT